MLQVAHIAGYALPDFPSKLGERVQNAGSVLSPWRVNVAATR